MIPIFIGMCLTISIILMLYRIGKGPSLLDRLIASDVLISIFMAGIILDMEYNNHHYNIPLLFILTSVGFTASVAVARYVRKQ